MRSAMSCHEKDTKGTQDSVSEAHFPQPPRADQMSDSGHHVRLTDSFCLTCMMDIQVGGFLQQAVRPHRQDGHQHGLPWHLGHARGLPPKLVHRLRNAACAAFILKEVQEPRCYEQVRNLLQTVSQFGLHSLAGHLQCTWRHSAHLPDWSLTSGQLMFNRSLANVYADGQQHISKQRHGSAGETAPACQSRGGSTVSSPRCR